jgi:hypothetical protein
VPFAGTLRELAAENGATVDWSTGCTESLSLAPLRPMPGLRDVPGRVSLARRAGLAIPVSPSLAMWSACGFSLWLSVRIW